MYLATNLSSQYLLIRHDFPTLPLPILTTFMRQGAVILGGGCDCDCDCWRDEEDLDDDDEDEEEDDFFLSIF